MTSEKGVYYKERYIHYKNKCNLISSELTGEKEKAKGLKESVKSKDEKIDSLLYEVNQLKQRVSDIIEGRITLSKNSITGLALRVVAQEYGMSPEVILKKSRKEEIVEPRQVVHYLCAKYSKTPYHIISNEIGGLERSGIYNSISKVENRMEIESDFRHQIIDIEDKIITEIRNIDG